MTNVSLHQRIYATATIHMEYCLYKGEPQTSTETVTRDLGGLFISTVIFHFSFLLPISNKLQCLTVLIPRAVRICAP
jgi:hypothetical protein